MLPFGLGGQYSQSSQESVTEGPFSSASGVIRGQSQNLLRDLLIGRYDQGGTLQNNGLLNLLQSRTQLPSTYQAPVLTSSGLLQEQQGAFDEAVRQALGQTSGEFVRRGFLRPENVQAIAGSAAARVAPQFAPLIAQNVAVRTNQPLVQEEQTRNRFSDFMNAVQLVTQLLGQQGRSSGSSIGAGGQISFGANAGGGTPTTPVNYFSSGAGH